METARNAVLHRASGVSCTMGRGGILSGTSQWMDVEGDFDTHIGIGIDTVVKYSTTCIICVDTMEPILVVHVLYVHDC